MKTFEDVPLVTTVKVVQEVSLSIYTYCPSVDAFFFFSGFNIFSI